MEDLICLLATVHTLNWYVLRPQAREIIIGLSRLDAAKYTKLGAFRQNAVDIEWATQLKEHFK